MRTSLRTVIFLLVSLAWFGHADAMDLCLSNGAQLAQALQTVNNVSNGTKINILLVRGNYAVGNSLGGTYGSESASIDVSIKGGYAPGSSCAESGRQINPSNTVIDGLSQNNGGIKFYGEDANFALEGVTITNISDAENAIFFYALGGRTVVDHCRILRNGANNAIYVAAKEIRFINNMVVNNNLLGSFASAASVNLPKDSILVATNNTVASNIGGNGLRALASNGSDRLSDISDNILWGNGAPDLDLSQFDVQAYPLNVSFNIIGTQLGSFQSGSTNISSDPRFANAAGGDYSLAANSPAINKGAFVQIWGFPPTDLSTNARIIGSRVDIGALESSINDLTTAVVSTVSDNGDDDNPTHGSLRAAIKASNAASGPFQIVFQIPSACPAILSLAAPMSDINGDITIDGTTQAGWSANHDFSGAFDANICLFINGSGGGAQWAFHVPSGAPTSARLVVRGLGFSGFSEAAIKLEGGANHRIGGNLFGAIAFTPRNDVAVQVTGNSKGAFIGGGDSDPASVNLIANSAMAGIFLDNAAGGSTVRRNVIGFQADGLAPGPNGAGVFVYNSPNNRISSNRIGYSNTQGVALVGTGSLGNLVQSNEIGRDRNGMAAGNGGAGIVATFGAHDNSIGAAVGGSADGNTVQFNGGPGIWISPTGAAGNRVLNNATFGNGGIGIDLGEVGPTANQATPPTSGPNRLQNHPTLTKATRSGSIDVIQGWLNASPNAAYRIDFYASGSCRADGRGEAELPAYHLDVSTNASGVAPLFVSMQSSTYSQLPWFSATATDASGNTSEISPCAQVSSTDIIFANGFD